MWWDLQYSGFRREQVRREIDERAGGPVTASGWKRLTLFSLFAAILVGCAERGGATSMDSSHSMSAPRFPARMS